MKGITKQELDKKFEELKKEATRQLEEVGLEWRGEFLTPQDFSPDWDYNQEDEIRWFNIVLGQMIMICELKAMN